MPNEYCPQCNLGFGSHEKRSVNGDMHIACARINRRNQIPLSARFGTMTEEEVNDYKRERAHQ